MTAAGHILIVDDDPESLRLLTGILTAEGYPVRPADSGQLALASIAANAPDLILMDIQMPDMDGFEVCRRLKASESYRDIPIIFISAKKEVEQHVEGLRLGAVDFVTKPHQREELLARVRNHLELGRLRTQLEKQVADRTAELRLANESLSYELREHIRVLRALRESEERFRNMADTAPIMIWVAGTDKLCTFFNKGWLAFTGRTMEQELGNGWVEGVHPDDLDRCIGEYSTSFDARRSFQMEYRLRRADREYRWLLDTGIPLFAPGGVFAGYIGSCNDITGLKDREEARLAEQKMESLGALAAGVAHDFNNLLGAILAEADLALSETPTGSPAHENIEKISAIAIRAAETVDLLATFAGSGAGPAVESVDVSALVEETLRLLRFSISKKAVLNHSLATGLPPVRANPAQLRRVVVNLVTNASEALENRKGSISVTAEFVHLDRDCARKGGPDLPKGDYVRLEVADTGSGMTEEARIKAFDPFYTTKFLGRGLGLAVVQGIIRSIGGAINLTNSPGAGATFEIFLPCERDPHASPANHTAPAKFRAPLTGSILLVEDEPMLRLAVSTALQKNGFVVIPACDGPAAVELFRAHAEEVDAVLLDITLPGMSGLEVLEAIHQIKADARVVLTSANNVETATLSEGAPGHFPVTFIRKPYRVSQCVSVLREVLAEKPACRNG